MNRLNDKVAIVTGATFGIGEATARLFAEENGKVVLVGRTADRLQQVVDEIVAKGGTAIGVAADVSKEDDWVRIVEATVNAYGKIDILINNAGVTKSDQTLELMTEEAWDHINTINVKGVWYGMRAVAPYMRKVGGGSIVNCSSIAALMGGQCSGNSIGYAASKGAVLSMSKSAAMSLAPDNIRVNTVHPGAVFSHIFEINRGITDYEVARKMFVGKTKLPMSAGEGIDVAYAYLYLASDESRFVTGTKLVVDGGWIAGW